MLCFRNLIFSVYYQNHLLIFLETYEEKDRNQIATYSNLAESTSGVLFVIIGAMINNNWKLMMFMEMISYLVTGYYFIQSS
jgi:hypothetical protein